MVKKIQYWIVLISVVSIGAGFAVKKLKTGTLQTIVIDPGHGGKDPGCNGVTHKEKDIALAVALKLGKLIEQNMKGVKVIYTRTTDVFVELEDRAQIANKAKADLFISIHCNAAGKPVLIKDPKTGKKVPKTFKNKKGKIVVVEKPNPVPFGTETYVMGLKNEEGKMKVATRENSAILLEDNYEQKYGGFDPESEESYIIMSNYTSAYVIQSANLAMKLQEEYARKAGRIDKGVHRQSIWVLWRTSMPSILTEIGYLTNPLEEQFLGSEKGQDYLAKAIYRGLRRYRDDLEGKKQSYNDEIENQMALENENVKAGNIPGQKRVEEDEEEEEEKKTEKIAEKKSPEVQSKENPKEENDSAVTKQVDPETHDRSDSAGAKEIAEKFRKKESEKKALPVKDSEKKEEKIVKEEVKPNIKREDFRQGQIVFKVQFASSEVELNLKDQKFSGLVEPSYYKMKNTYKYTSGSYKDLKEAAAHQAQLREKGFRDCFVIAMKDGERVDINEAKKQIAQ